MREPVGTARTAGYKLLNIFAETQCMKENVQKDRRSVTVKGTRREILIHSIVAFDILPESDVPSFTDQYSSE